MKNEIIESINYALSALQEIYPTIDWDNEAIKEDIIASIEENLDEIEEMWDNNQVPHDIYWSLVKRYMR